MRHSSGRPARHVRPLHPPLTHFPIAAYVMAAGFDVISVVGGHRHVWAGQLWHAGTFVLVAGLAICLLTMVTGFADLVRFGEQRPEVVRGIAAHVCVMAAVFMVGVGDVAWRLTDLHRTSTPPGVLILTVTAAVGVCIGGYLGGTLVYRHGTGVSVPAAGAQANAVDTELMGRTTQ
jgi:uncharacterized membrane protein